MLLALAEEYPPVGRRDCKSETNATPQIGGRWTVDIGGPNLGRDKKEGERSPGLGRSGRIAVGRSVCTQRPACPYLQPGMNPSRRLEP